MNTITIIELQGTTNLKCSWVCEVHWSSRIRTYRVKRLTSHMNNVKNLHNAFTAFAPVDHNTPICTIICLLSHRIRAIDYN